MNMTTEQKLAYAMATLEAIKTITGVMDEANKIASNATVVLKGITNGK
jgi:hypothetical protein